MGTEERRKREKERRRRQILDAAKELISERGSENLTMDEIADRAELSKGTLYLYFENKSALNLAITRRELEKLQASYHEIIQQDKTGYQLIEQMGETLLDFVSGNPGYMNHMMMNEARRPGDSPSDTPGDSFSEYPGREAFDEIARKLLMTITRAIQIGMQDGSIASDVNPRILAIQLWGGMRGLLHLLCCGSDGPIRAALEESGESMQSMVRQFNKVLLNGIGTRQPDDRAEDSTGKNE